MKFRFLVATFLLLQLNFASADDENCVSRLLKSIFGNKAPEQTVEKTVQVVEEVKLWNGEKMPIAMIGSKVLQPRILDKAFYGNKQLPPGYQTIEDIFKKGLPERGQNWDLNSHVEESWKLKGGQNPVNDTAFRGTTPQISSPDGTIGAINWADEGGYVYEIRGVPGWEVNTALEGRVAKPDGTFRDNLMSGELETAIPAKVPGKFICRVGRPSLSNSGRLIIRSTDWVVNPYAAKPPCD